MMVLDTHQLPTVAIGTAPLEVGNVNATAVAITTERGGVTSIESIRITNAGQGYTQAPTITISGGGGSGAAATCSVETTLRGVTAISVDGRGKRLYTVAPTILLS